MAPARKGGKGKGTASSDAGSAKGKTETEPARTAAAASKTADTSTSTSTSASPAGTTLFVSHLPYEATSTDLETFFSAVGPIRRAFVVTDPVTRFSKGVGYVTFALPADAEQALKTLQGAKLQGAAKKGKAIRIEVAKQRGSLKERKRKREEPAGKGVASADKEEAGSKRVKTAHKEQEHEDEEGDEDEEDDDEDVSDEDDDADSNEDDSDADDSSDDDEEVSEDDDEDDDGDSEEAEEEEDDTPKDRPKLPTPSEGTTLFVRNLSYTTTEPDLRALFARFGALRYAKITMDKASGRSRGTGFVCFWNRADAERVLEAARRVAGAAGTGVNAISAGGAGASDTKKSNPFSLTAASSSTTSRLPAGVHSVLTADPSAPLASTLTLHGRLLSVVPAVERTTAEKLGTAALRERQKADKRNTYLMREGVPLPKAPPAALEGTCLPALSEKDKERRLDEFNRRKAQLERNPSLYISKTRLSVRQLPLFVTSKVLKRLAIHAVREFRREVKAGTRRDLDEEERADGTLSPALVAASDRDSRKARKRAERPTVVIQAKVVRQLDRVDPITGEGRSRGYGFLEMRSFQDALRVLRWANGRRELGELMRGWWVEELERSVGVLKKGGGGGGGEKKKASQDQKGASGGGGKEDEVTTATRIHRLEKKIKELKAGIVDKAERGGGTVVIEFSIENAVVTKKRRDRVVGGGGGGGSSKGSSSSRATAGSARRRK